jgi:hypothetical protein
MLTLFPFVAAAAIVATVERRRKKGNLVNDATAPVQTVNQDRATTLRV